MDDEITFAFLMGVTAPVFYIIGLYVAIGWLADKIMIPLRNWFLEWLN